MVVPPFLTNGKSIGIVAPGRRVSLPELETGVKFLESQGYKTVLGKNIFSTTHSYLAGTDEERLADLQTMLDSDQIDAILCARGGYGTTRIIDRLDFFRYLNNPKWIIGFSDITALHLRLYRHGIESIHGIMPLLFSKPNAVSSVQSLMELMKGNEAPVEWPSIEYNRPGTARGQVIGGNLSLLVDSLGTRDEPDTSNKILVIEEIEEYKYKIDRMLVQLKRCGKLDNLAGLVAGHFTDILDTEVTFGETVEEIILDKVREYNYPVSFHFPSGHEQPNIAWKHGHTMVLDVNEDTSRLYSS